MKRGEPQGDRGERDNVDIERGSNMPDENSEGDAQERPRRQNRGRQSGAREEGRRPARKERGRG